MCVRGLKDAVHLSRRVEAWLCGFQAAGCLDILTTSSLGGNRQKPAFVDLADFHDVSVPTRANFKLPIVMSLNTEQGNDGQTGGSLP